MCDHSFLAQLQPTQIPFERLAYMKRDGNSQDYRPHTSS